MFTILTVDFPSRNSFLFRRRTVSHTRCFRLNGKPWKTVEENYVSLMWPNLRRSELWKRSGPEYRICLSASVCFHVEERDNDSIHIAPSVTYFFQLLFHFRFKETVFVFDISPCAASAQSYALRSLGKNVPSRRERVFSRIQMKQARYLSSGFL